MFTQTRTYENAHHFFGSDHEKRDRGEKTGVNYSTFGAMQTGRAGGSYRYGFNGKENDDEINNVKGSWQDYGMRMYDPRVGRFFSADPLMFFYPHYTPYQFAGNKPISATDLDGMEENPVNRDPNGTNSDAPGGSNEVVYGKMPNVENYLYGDQIVVGGANGQLIYTVVEINGHKEWKSTSTLLNTQTVVGSKGSAMPVGYTRGVVGSDYPVFCMTETDAILGMFGPVVMRTAELQSKAFAEMTGGTWSGGEFSGYNVTLDPGVGLGLEIATELFMRTGKTVEELSPTEYSDLFTYHWDNNQDRSDLFLVPISPTLAGGAVAVPYPSTTTIVVPAMPGVSVSQQSRVIPVPPGILAKEKVNDYFGKKGGTLKGGSKNQRDGNYLNQYDKDFQNWFHKVYKKGMRGAKVSNEVINEAYQEWIDLGNPKGPK